MIFEKWWKANLRKVLICDGFIITADCVRSVYHMLKKYVLMKMGRLLIAAAAC